MYLLDTNICIYLIKRKPVEVLKHFQKVDLGRIGISSVTHSELMFGVEKSQFPEKNLEALEKFTVSLNVFSYDPKASRFYGKVRHYLEAKGTPIGAMDTLIAAHALSRNCILVTNNTKEFQRVPNLKIENWIEN